jgi:hypothetical protein
VRDNVTISYRGASYEIGQGPAFYGIWTVGQPRSQPLEWWPNTPEGWYAAWSRFVSIELPATIVPVAQSTAPVAQSTAPVAQAAEQVAGASRSAVVAAALLVIGVACGIAGLFPDYLNNASLVRQPDELVPHAIYFAVWSASTLLILLGGDRQRVGALLGMGTSIVTFGLFFADSGTAIAGGAHLMGAGLVLGLVGWLACSAGSTVAFALTREGVGIGRPRGSELVPFLACSLAALGVAAAFAPSWDSYVLQTSAGATESLTAGNVFSNPAPVIAGNVAVMVAFVAVVAVAALWRPLLHGGVLLAGAVIPMAAQAVSAIIQIGGHTSPTMFGISSSAAAQSGLTITSGLTLAFWIYCVFVVVLIVVGASAVGAPRPLEPAGCLHAPSAQVTGHYSPTIPAMPPGSSPVGPEPKNASPSAPSVTPAGPGLPDPGVGEGSSV